MLHISIIAIALAIAVNAQAQPLYKQVTPKQAIALLKQNKNAVAYSCQPIELKATYQLVTKVNKVNRRASDTTGHKLARNEK